MLCGNDFTVLIGYSNSFGQKLFDPEEKSYDEWSAKVESKYPMATVTNLQLDVCPVQCLLLPGAN